MDLWMEIWTVVSNIAVALAAMAAYLYLLGFLYPRFTLRLTRKGDLSLGDRGLRRVTFPGGRAVIYAPSPKIQRYISRYALVKRENGVFIQCRIHSRIAYLRYDVVTFDRRGRLLDVLRVSERITVSGQTRMVRLPGETAYATLTLRRVDGVYVSREAVVGYGLLGMGIYLALSTVTATAVGALLHGSISEMLTVMMGRQVWEIRSLGATLAASALLGLLGSVCVLLLHELHRERVINK